MRPIESAQRVREQPAIDDIGRLLVTCEDRPGIVAAVARFLHEQGANILESDQYSDPAGGRFFLRMEFDLPGLQQINGALEREFDSQIAHGLGLEWRITHAARRKRVAILVSREDHCLLELLWRWRRHELDADIGQVISNHPDFEPQVEQFGVPFVHVPVERGRKSEAEARQLDLLADRFDLVVLARYMQILSGDFLERIGAPVINIHHSFLPAFAGAGPHQKAKDRGVKLIGATAHYVTEELDAGPIIEQDVVRVSHREDVATLMRLGSDIERTVLMRAVSWHCDDRVLVNGGTTVVF